MKVIKILCLLEIYNAQHSRVWLESKAMFKECIMVTFIWLDTIRHGQISQIEQIRYLICRYEQCTISIKDKFTNISARCIKMCPAIV